jgi:hypothetical protein
MSTSQPNYRTRAYTLTQIAKLVDVPIATVRTWMKRRHIWFEDSEMMHIGSAGVPHMVGWPSVMRVALMARLTAYGIAPERAWQATIAFTEIGEVGLSLGGEDAQELREPGATFKTGRTVLVLYLDEDVGRVVNMQPTTPWDALLMPEMGRQSRHEDALFIDINALEARLLKAAAEEARR